MIKKKKKISVDEIKKSGHTIRGHLSKDKLETIVNHIIYNLLPSFT